MRYAHPTQASIKNAVNELGEIFGKSFKVTRNYAFSLIHEQRNQFNIN